MPAMSPPRSPAPAVLSAVALVVLILGVWPNWWFSGKMKSDSEFMDEEMEMSMDLGLREVAVCSMGRCGSMGFSNMPIDGDDEEKQEVKEFKRFVWAGGATFWAGMVCAGAMIASVLLWTMRQRMPFSVPTVAGALGAVTAIAGTIAFLMKPQFPSNDLMQFEFGMSVGYPLCLLGSIGCAIGGFMLAKDEKTHAPFGAAQPYAHPPVYQAGPYPGQVGYGQPPAPQISPACPRCAAPTMFVAEHQRYFC